MRTLILTVIGSDRPGIVSLLSSTLADHGANWEASSMARMAGQFAGILNASVEVEREHGLRLALSKLSKQGLTVVIARSGAQTKPHAHVRLDIVGDDRPGIVQSISAALSAAGANVEELETRVEEAPMSGGMLFKARIVAGVGDHVNLDELRAGLEAIAGELLVDITLDDAG